MANPQDVNHCREWKQHTDCPVSYLEWHDWAEKKAKTHRQLRCPACGLFAIWVKKPSPRSSGAAVTESETDRTTKTL